MTVSLRLLAGQGCSEKAAEFCVNERASVIHVVKTILTKQTELIAYEQNDARRPQSLVYSAAHYTQETAQIERICRLLWAAVPLCQDEPRFCEFLRKEVVRGTDPNSPNYWGEAKDFDQCIVEMSAIAVAIVDAKAVFWDGLTETEKDNLARWLLSATHCKLPPNNWRWFRILILTALERVGIEIDADVKADDLAFVEALYKGDGWFADGASGVLDNYNPFAFQLYGLVYARWNNYQGAESSRFIDAAIQFSESYQSWFGHDGAPLAYGRSLNYRFAGIAFWTELAQLTDSRVDVGLCKSYWAASLNWWADKPIWEQSGVLLPGFSYPNLNTTEFYTSAASPLLALKGFNALALHSEHPFWKTPSTAIADRRSECWVNDCQLLWRNKSVYMITNAPGSAELRNCTDKYQKYAYSSAHGFCVESSRWINQGWAGDNIISVRHPQTGEWHERKSNVTATREGDSLVSVWQPFEGCRIRVVQSKEREKEVRRVFLLSDFHTSMIVTGYAVDAWQGWFSHEQQREPKIESERLFSALIPVKGNGVSAIYPCAPNSNNLYPHACVPAITYEVPEGESKLEFYVKAGSF